MEFFPTGSNKPILEHAGVSQGSTDVRTAPVEALSADLNYNGFSHTRAYTVAAGSHTFYGVCQNYVETDGSGTASNYASLSVEFFPD